MASASGPERKKTKPWKQEINHPIVEPSLISSDMIEIDGSILEGVGYTVCMHVCMYACCCYCYCYCCCRLYCVYACMHVVVVVVIVILVVVIVVVVS